MVESTGEIFAFNFSRVQVTVDQLHSVLSLLGQVKIKEVLNTHKRNVYFPFDHSSGKRGPTTSDHDT